MARRGVLYRWENPKFVEEMRGLKGRRGRGRGGSVKAVRANDGLRDQGGGGGGGGGADPLGEAAPAAGPWTGLQRPVGGGRVHVAGRGGGPGGGGRGSGHGCGKTKGRLWEAAEAAVLESQVLGTEGIHHWRQ